MKQNIVVILLALCCIVSQNVLCAAEQPVKQNLAAAVCCEAQAGFAIPPKPVYDFAPHDDPSTRQGLMAAFIAEPGCLRASRLNLVASYVNNGPLFMSARELQESQVSGMMNSFVAVSDSVDPINRGCLLLQRTLKNLRHNKEVLGLPETISLDYDSQERVICGGALMYAIRNNAAINALDLNADQPRYINALRGNLDDYLRSIVDLTFYMYAEAINKGQQFTDGSFIVLDSDLKLWNFLMYYVRLQNQKLSGTNSDKQVACSTDNDRAYCRKSSHLSAAQQEKDETLNRRHYGIDLRSTAGAELKHDTATGMPHILFGLVGRTRGASGIPALFIKLEDAGIALSVDWFLHAFGFVGSTGRKWADASTPGCFVSEALKACCGSNAGQGSQKERISAYFLWSCYHIFSQAECPKWEFNGWAPAICMDELCCKPFPKEYKEDYKAMAEKGIKELARLIDNKPLHWSQEVHKAFVEFYEKQCEFYDYPTVRTGDEVIIGRAEYQSCPFYFCMLKAMQAKNAPYVRDCVTSMAWVCEQMYENEQKLRRCDQSIENINAGVRRMMNSGYCYLRDTNSLRSKRQILINCTAQRQALLDHRAQCEQFLAQQAAALNALEMTASRPNIIR